MSKYTRKQGLVAKLETTYGTDAAPTGAANAMLISGMKLKALNQQLIERDIVRGRLARAGGVEAGVLRQHAAAQGDLAFEAIGLVGQVLDLLHLGARQLALVQLGAVEDGHGGVGDLALAGAVLGQPYETHTPQTDPTVGLIATTATTIGDPACPAIASCGNSESASPIAPAGRHEKPSETTA